MDDEKTEKEIDKWFKNKYPELNKRLNDENNEADIYDAVAELRFKDDKREELKKMVSKKKIPFKKLPVWKQSFERYMNSKGRYITPEGVFKAAFELGVRKGKNSSTKFQRGCR